MSIAFATLLIIAVNVLVQHLFLHFITSENEINADPPLELVRFFLLCSCYFLFKFLCCFGMYTPIFSIRVFGWNETPQRCLCVNTRAFATLSVVFFMYRIFGGQIDWRHVSFLFDGDGFSISHADGDIEWNGRAMGNRWMDERMVTVCLSKTWCLWNSIDNLHGLFFYAMVNP